MRKRQASSRPNRRKRLGDAAEQIAAQHVSAAGTTVLHTNFRSRFGEVDLIIFDAPHLAFVEVRYRGAHARGDAAATVTTKKQRRIINTARFFLTRYPRWHTTPIRFDVIAIDGMTSREQKLQWIRNAFDADGYD